MQYHVLYMCSCPAKCIKTSEVYTYPLMKVLLWGLNWFWSSIYQTNTKIPVVQLWIERHLLIYPPPQTVRLFNTAFFSLNIYFFPLEICMTSNIKTQTVPSCDNHHFGYWYKMGHPAVLCVSHFHCKEFIEIMSIKNMDTGSLEPI